MQNLHEVETGLLMEMLVQQTALLTSKIAEKNSIEVQQYEYDISMIQAELNSRQIKNNISISDPTIEISSDTD
jgi:hypothetical protein